MLSADAGVVFPGKDSVPNWDVFLLCPPFAQLLFDWCSRHNWVPDEQGFSVMEMYFAFTAETGWLAPVNVAKWDKAARPAPFEKVSVKAAWVHQVQCPQISLCAQPLTSQVLTFCAQFCPHANAHGSSVQSLLYDASGYHAKSQHCA